MLSYLQNLPTQVYCERIINLSSEPLNSFSNLAIFVSAFLTFKLVQKHKVNSNIKILPLLLLALGVGSTLWHAFPNPLTLLADFIPIWFFVFSAVYILLTQLFSNKKVIWLLLGTFILIQSLITIYLPQDFLNGSGRYLMALLVGILLLIKVHQRSPQLSVSLLLPITIFGLGIFIRTIDRQICPFIPFGTHFIWHILIAIATFYIVRFLIKAEQTLKK